ncbi:hypothetical protein CCR75_005827 [Bremia lactucae]|uniref:Uncharacterized protein n=1 Tax=Bremia lactucae TaxID=4779 RepID=A0A976IEG7_BRELC|nr:hypothetical protein CCR75_005827 [Bremia lactucae]
MAFLLGYSPLILRAAEQSANAGLQLVLLVCDCFSVIVLVHLCCNDGPAGVRCISKDAHGGLPIDDECCSYADCARLFRNVSYASISLSLHNTAIPEAMRFFRSADLRSTLSLSYSSAETRA